MTDGRQESGLDAFDISRQRDALRAESLARRQRGERLGRRAQILAAREEAAAAAPAGELAVRATAVVPAKEPERADPAAQLRWGRLGAVTALALALVLVWLRQEKGR